MTRFRRIAFYLFAALYLLVCPLTLLYAFGVIFVPDVEDPIVRTGLISVSTQPSRAAVMLNGSLQTDQTPLLIQELMPGYYDVAVRQEGYQPWQDRVRVVAGRATVLEDLLLFAETPELRSIAGLEAKDLLHLGNDRMIFVRGSTLEAWMMYDAAVEAGEALAGPQSPWSGYAVAETWTDEEAPQLLLRVKQGADERYLWMDAKPEHPRLEDITRLIVNRPERVLWDGRRPDILWVIHPEGVDRVDRKAATVSPKISGPIRGAGPRQGRLLALYDDGLLKWLDGEEAMPAEDYAGPDWAQLKGWVSLRLIGSALAAIDEDGALYASTRVEPIIASGVRSLKLHPRYPVLLVQGRDFIGWFDANALHAQADEPRIHWLLQGAEIDQAFWADEGRYILFRGGRQASLIQLWRGSAPDARELVRLQGHTGIAWSESRGELYFLHPEDAQVRVLRLIPEQRLPFIAPPAAEERT